MRRLVVAACIALVPLSSAAQDHNAWIGHDGTSGEGVRGAFVERGGSYTFVPENLQDSIDGLPAVGVSNSETISPLATGINLDVRLHFNAETGLAEVSGYKIADTNSEPIPGTNLSVEDTPLAKFRAELSRSLQPGAMAADLSNSLNSPIGRAQAKFEREASEIYNSAIADGNTGQRTAAVRQIAAIRRQAKAIFGPTIDNYDPWTYGKIHLRSRSVVAIADSSLGKPVCSGFLIAPDLVMTAGHCFKAGDVTDVEIWFGFEETELGISSEPRRHLATHLVFPVVSQHPEFFQRAASDNFSGDFLDLAILRFSLTECSGGVVCDPIPPEVQPACLRTRRVHRDLPLYLIGYPSGNRAKVHDNARMYLPHSVNKFILKNIRKEIEVDFAALPEEDRVALVEDLTASYRPDGNRFKLFDQQFGGQPKFGLVADTFKGNSGSPVFFRTDHCVVGMLIGGAPDTGERLLPSWINHETAVPMSAIVEAIRADPQSEPLLNLIKQN